MSEPSAPATFSRLPYYVRFRDLRAAGICDNWESLSRMIDDYGFPTGILLSPNVRAWDVDEVNKWLTERPTERKVVLERKRKTETV